MRYLTPQTIFVIHATLREAYKRRSEGRTFEPRWPYDETMARLEAATSRPRHSFAGQAQYRLLFHKVAALGHGITEGHCFGNGNKRTAFVAMQYMMAVNGWDMQMPPAIVAFMMLRAASNHNRMSVEQMAILIGAFSRVNSRIGYRAESDRLVRAGSLIVDLPDDFPASVPFSKPPYYVRKANLLLERHGAWMTTEEEALYRASFDWPAKAATVLVSFWNVQEHALLQKRIRRRRGKRVGKRLPPHKGGRSVPKICGRVREGLLPRPAVGEAKIIEPNTEK